MKENGFDSVDALAVISGYIAGIIDGEGSVSSNPKNGYIKVATNTDMGIIDGVCEHIQSLGILKHSKNIGKPKRKKDGTLGKIPVDVKVYGAKHMSILVKTGYVIGYKITHAMNSILNRKRLTNKERKEIKEILESQTNYGPHNNDWAAGFIAASIDGEGTVYYDTKGRHYRVKVCNTDHKFLDTYQSCLKTLGIESKKGINKKATERGKGDCYEVRVSLIDNLEKLVYLPLLCREKLGKLVACVIRLSKSRKAA